MIIPVTLYGSPILRKHSTEVTEADQDVFFSTIEKELDGMQARIYQHEYDHLEGILFIDKLSPLRRKLLTGKLNMIKKTTNQKIKTCKKIIRLKKQIYQILKK